MIKKVYLPLLFLFVTAVMQEFVMSRITLFNVSADVVTIFLAYIAVTTNKNPNTSFGFAAGVLTGLLSGNLGLNMLARTVGSFIAGYFHTPKESHATAKQKSKRFYGAIIVATLCTNAILVAAENPLGFSTVYRIVVFGMLESFYNLIFAVILDWLFLRQSLVN